MGQESAAMLTGEGDDREPVAAPAEGGRLGGRTYRESPLAPNGSYCMGISVFRDQ